MCVCYYKLLDVVILLYLLDLFCLASGDTANIFPVSQVVNRGRNAYITCISRDPPVWIRHNHKLDSFDTTIILYNMQLDDSGNYICNGTDVLTQKKFSAAAEVWVSNAGMAGNYCDKLKLHAM